MEEHELDWQLDEINTQGKVCVRKLTNGMAIMKLCLSNLVMFLIHSADFRGITLPKNISTVKGPSQIWSVMFFDATPHLCLIYFMHHS